MHVVHPPNTHSKSEPCIAKSLGNSHRWQYTQKRAPPPPRLSPPTVTPCRPDQHRLGGGGGWSPPLEPQFCHRSLLTLENNKPTQQNSPVRGPGMLSENYSPIDSKLKGAICLSRGFPSKSLGAAGQLQSQLAHIAQETTWGRIWTLFQGAPNHTKSCFSKVMFWP